MIERRNQILKDVLESTRLEEEAEVLERLLIEIHFFGNYSTKALARELFLPVPVVAAIKKEFIRRGILYRDAKVHATAEGRRFIEEELGFRGLDLPFYKKLLKEDINIKDEFSAFWQDIESVYENRPGVDVTIDQSRGTPETAFKRAILCLRKNAFVGKRVLCVGDDDLVSVAIGFLQKKLFPTGESYPCEVTVIDIDKRYLSFIDETAARFKLPIVCREHDLKNPLPEDLTAVFSAAFTDPPYTMPGAALFLSRAVQGVEKRRELPVFFSFPHKPANFILKLQKLFLDLGLAQLETLPRFNRYIGAEIIGNMSQMILLKTTSVTAPVFKDDFDQLLYSGEIRQTIRVYKCKGCEKRIQVGQDMEYTTIEELKAASCPICGGGAFDIVIRKKKG